MFSKLPEDKGILADTMKQSSIGTYNGFQSNARNYYQNH